MFKFPENRENNRAFSTSGAILTTLSFDSRSNVNALYPDSYVAEQGNTYARTGNSFNENREFSQLENNN